MKMRQVSLGVIAALSLCGSSAFAGSNSVAVEVTPKKENGEKKRMQHTTVAETLVQYTVKVTNLTFSPLSGLSAQYRVFVRDDSGKGTQSQQKLKQKAFSAIIPDIPGRNNNGVYSFDTEPVKLEKAVLDGNYYYVDGSRSQSADRVMGFWIRIFQGDKMVGEYVNPASLSAQEKF